MTAKSKTSLPALNAMSCEDFVRVAGPFFEHSPWIAARTWAKRPFGDTGKLHSALCAT
ncbi:MAG: 2-oxo-4-hydroxy-4-carboxy-5-ureidoimidazoline decarboxylase, partial [Tepidisphaeraceae bacterium]